MELPSDAPLEVVVLRDLDRPPDDVKDEPRDKEFVVSKPLSKFVDRSEALVSVCSLSDISCDSPLCAFDGCPRPMVVLVDGSGRLTMAFSTIRRGESRLMDFSDALSDSSKSPCMDSSCAFLFFLLLLPFSYYVFFESIKILSKII